MSVLRRSRDRFDAEIEDRFNVVLVLSGAARTPAQEVHDAARQLAHPWRKIWILRHVEVLTEEEQELWVGGPQRFAFYNCEQQETRSWGPVGDLIGPNGEPDLLLIRDHFAEAEIKEPGV